MIKTEQVEVCCHAKNNDIFAERCNFKFGRGLIISQLKIIILKWGLSDHNVLPYAEFTPLDEAISSWRSSTHLNYRFQRVYNFWVENKIIIPIKYRRLNSRESKYKIQRCQSWVKNDVRHWPSSAVCDLRLEGVALLIRNQWVFDNSH